MAIRNASVMHLQMADLNAKTKKSQYAEDALKEKLGRIGVIGPLVHLQPPVLTGCKNLIHKEMKFVEDAFGGT